MPAFVHDRSPHASFPPPPPSQFLRSLPMDLTLSPPLSPTDSDPHSFLPSFHGPHDPAYQLLHDDVAHPHSTSYPPSPSPAFLRGCTPYPPSSPSNIHAFNASLDYGLLFCAEQNVDGIAACCNAFPRTSLMQHPCSCNYCSFGCPTESVCASEPMNQNEEMTLARSWPAIDHFNDDFRMYDFKVKRCMRGRSHDWTECPFAHPGEKARRRDPRRIRYSGTPCPDFRKGACKRGDACEFAHGVFECWLHPARYRTQPCKDGENCKRRVCFFAHTSKQLRQPSESSISSASDVQPTSSSQSNRLRFGTSALVERSPRQRPMIDRLMVLERSNRDEPSDTIDTLLGLNGYEDGRDVPFDDSSLSYGHLKAGHLALKGTTQYMKEDFGFLSPTSTLVRHPYSPPLSPLQSPSSHSAGFGRLAPGTTCAPHSFPSSRFIEESIHGAKDLDCLSASFNNMELMGLQKDPDLQVQGFQSEHTHLCSPRIPSSQQGSGWGNHDLKLETAARGQASGEALRAEVFNKICKENVDNQMPDLGWVSELVK